MRTHFEDTVTARHPPLQLHRASRPRSGGGVNMTRANALSALNALNPIDAIEVIRSYAWENLADGYGVERIDAGLDECLAEIREDDRLPRFVIDYTRTGTGVLL